MAKAARKNITPRRTAPSSQKSSPKSATARPGQVDAPAKIDTAVPAIWVPPGSREKCNHFGNAEEQICDLMRAASLSACLTDDLLTEGRTATGSGSLYIYLPEEFAERLIFAADEVTRRVRALKNFFYNDGFDDLDRATPAE
jgi:hypothetical protein